jgi:hypothetical protein
VTPVDLGKSTSLALNEKKLNEMFKGLNGKPDAVIFTPLLYNDDHQVSTSDTETVTGLFEEKVRISYPDVAFYVSLPNYSADADYMNDRIDGLKSYIEDQKIPELDYLSKWAKGEDREKLVASDGHTMNSQGRQVWLDYISKAWGLEKNKDQK